jgi:deoxyribodipyrimidine photo-lyase
MSVVTIVWLRNDLRLDDHHPLALAAARGAVLPVYCIDPRQFGTLPSGAPKTGAFRARFVIETLADLRAACRARGGELAIRYGEPEVVLPALAREIGATHVVYHEEAASEETTVEAAVEAALAAIGVRTERFWGHTLYHPDDLPFAVDELPDTFTTFRKLVERATTPRAPIDAPARISTPSIDPGDLPTLASLGATAIEDDPRVLFRPVGGETTARARLQHYIWDTDRLRVYKDTRNGLLNVDDSSKLSPWLALGAVSPRRIWSDVLRYERERVQNESTYWMIFELLWRDYFRFVAVRWENAIFQRGGLQRLALPWRALRDARTEGDFARWTSGTTGYPLVDAAMRELAVSGYTSNRARQNVASFLTKNLGIDWTMGAEWFESLLVDYDVTSNWGNWTYSAGVGNDARGFRFFNIHKQAAQYDPDHAFVKHWIPELGTSAYPEPMVDLFASAKLNEAKYRQAVGWT